MTPRHKWYELYQAARLELHPEKLKDKIAAAETAIFARFQEIANETDHSEERASLDDALNAIRVLQTQRLGYPGSPTKSEPTSKS
jgi:hypothetical protein